MQQDHEPSREDPAAGDGTVPGHRSGHGAGSLLKQMQRDEQRRENSDSKADDARGLPVPQRSATD